MASSPQGRLDSDSPRSVDVVVVGAGFAGVYLTYRLTQLGLQVQTFEAGDEVGGTWYWNRYPGARCDVESMQYSYSFSLELQQEWSWSERFAAQPEILKYIQHVADRFDLRRFMTFKTRVTAATFDAADNHWTITTDQGTQVRCHFCIMASGTHSAAQVPDFPGGSQFAGSIYHTALWPSNGVSFEGQRVGVIGTGSSGVQAIPLIAEQARQLLVFQRTPAFCVPARNCPMTPEYERQWKDNYAARRAEARATRVAVRYEFGTQSALAVTPEERQREFDRRWKAGGTNFLYAYNDLLRNEQSNAFTADYVRTKIAEVVKDPQVAERLTPRSYPIATKRICIDSNYYETYNRPNVELIDIHATPIVALSRSGLRTTAQEYPLDSLVFATGFDAVTGALLNIDIRGRQGLTLSDKWRAGARAYLGLAAAGFPNLFLINGPGSPSVLTNMVMSIEQNADWIANCIVTLNDRASSYIEASEDAEGAWVDHVREVVAPTLYAQTDSWFLGANIPGKPRVFLPYIGGFANYAARCDQVARNGYEGFRIGSD